ncbi:acyl-CoA dehydrogenase [Kibdelosporangium banguiense]|uniref:Acyl-CoA dehydrogenase n=1 Tax=Kibdelosporangium banguiense TaxID=1365924 RepID=A0ABS4TMJ7_9PSEU|nr:acyl-CoA dehydrogenase family protein [Kibdelosporangium banguiense]MBP2325224.1 acyl-CoA dehydrogenase [Kibdelosporangium banguiense]
MQLVLNQEQEDLRASVRKFFQEQAPMAKVRTVVDGGPDFDRDLWRRMAGELGLTALAIPEEFGGVGASQIERSIVLEEIGRALVPSPYLSSAVLAADLLLATEDTSAKAEFLPSIASGEVLAVSGRGDVTVSSGKLDGQTGPVLDGASADIALVQTDDGIYLVDLADVAKTPLVSYDPTRRFARLTFAGTPARRLAGDHTAAVAHAGDLAAVALAAESVGILARAMEMAVEYAKVRVQFGRFIGSYQAVKHSCVNSYVDYELAYSVVRHAAWAASHALEELPVAAAHARALVLPAAFRVAARTIEVHGGIGYTWEHDAHLYYKRAKTNELLLGESGQLADRLSL